MRRAFIFVPVMVFGLAGLALGQAQQRPNPPEFSHSMSIEGAGKVTITYRSLHWNEPAYNSAKQNDQIRERLNTGLWKRIGTFSSDIDLTIGNVPVPKGTYTLGINFDANDNFKLVLGSNGKDIAIPLTTEKDGPLVSYLAFDLRPAEGGGYVIEGRSGKFRSWADVKVP